MNQVDQNGRDNRRQLESIFNSLKENNYSKAISLCESSNLKKNQDPEFYLLYSTALRKAVRSHEAIEIIRTGLRFYPSNHKFLYELGLNQLILNDYTNSLNAFLLSDKISPSNKKTLFQIGMCHYRLGNYIDAINKFIEVLSLDPQYYLAWLNLGASFTNLKNIDAAIEAFSMIPNDHSSAPTAYYNKSLCFLLKHDLNNGWREYEWRRKIKESPLDSSKFSIPEWNGLYNEKNKILILNEQGIGDEVFFARWLSALSMIDNDFTVIIDDRLLNIYQRSFSKIKFIPKSHKFLMTEFDSYLPLGSLPLKINGEAHRKEPYLIANKNGVDEFQKILGFGKRINVGISWISKNSESGIFRSIQLQKMLSIFKDLDVNIISLQYGDLGSDLPSIAKVDSRIQCLESIDKFNDIDSIVDLIEACDLVISVDNSIVHFSGALGKTTFALLNYSSDWRWGISGNTTPWYKSIELFRQNALNSWDQVIDRARERLIKITDL